MAKGVLKAGLELNDSLACAVHIPPLRIFGSLHKLESVVLKLVSFLNIYCRNCSHLTTNH